MVWTSWAKPSNMALLQCAALRNQRLQSHRPVQSKRPTFQPAGWWKSDRRVSSPMATATALYRWRCLARPSLRMRTWAKRRRFIIRATRSAYEHNSLQDFNTQVKFAQVDCVAAMTVLHQSARGLVELARPRWSVLQAIMQVDLSKRGQNKCTRTPELRGRVGNAFQMALIHGPLRVC